MIRKNGHVIETMDRWAEFARPKSPNQWQDDRSAKQCARAWLSRPDPTRILPDIEQVLRTSPDFGDIIEWEGEPECHVHFDEFSGPANIDVMISARDEHAPLSIVVEAKSDEPFGSLLGDAFARALEERLKQPSSKALPRLEQLAASILPPGMKPGAQHIRYQLLTATAAVLSHAVQTGAERAVVIVHEFQTVRTDPKNLERNRRDLTSFLTRLGFAKPTDAFERRLIGPLLVPGGNRYRTPPGLYFGKVVVS